MARLGTQKKRSYDQGVVFHSYEKWLKVVVLLREYENISNMSLKIYTMSLSNIDGMK